MKKVLPVALVCLSLFIACKKDNAPDPAPAVLPADLVLKSITYGPPKVYGNTAEVTDTTLIAAAKISTNYNVYTFRDATYAPDQYPTMYFTGNADAPNLRNGSRTYSVVRSGADFVCTSNDSSVFQTPVYGYGSFNSYASEPFLKYSQYAPAGNGLVVQREKLFASGDYSKLTVKGVVLLIVKRDPVTKAHLSHTYNSSSNQFNINGIQALGRYDTLIMRPYDLLYQKR